MVLFCFHIIILKLNPEAKIKDPGFVIILKNVTPKQCDQKKIAKCLLKWPKNDRKMIDFDNITKIP